MTVRLRLGDSGTEVARLQTLLVQNNADVKVDGDFGSMTQRAVMTFQTNHHIGSDGIVGPATWAELEHRMIEPVEREDPKENGLLVNGSVVPVPGVKVIGPHDAAWSHLSAGDCRKRRPNPASHVVEVTQWVLHKTIADDPEIVVPGAGPPGGARKTADYWAGDPRHSGAHLVTGDDGELACLADLLQVESFHDSNNVSNTLSVGHETREKFGGFCYEAALETTVRATLVGCAALGVQLQTPKPHAYHNDPMPRFRDGGLTLVGIFGHRDVTTDRGKWDPGEILFDMLRARGVESFDFNAGEDVVVWRGRHASLARMGHDVDVGGIPNAKTRMALLAEGYTQGIWALGRANFHG